MMSKIVMALLKAGVKNADIKKVMSYDVKVPLMRGGSQC
jgi:hypothetical protein